MNELNKPMDIRTTHNNMNDIAIIMHEPPMNIVMKIRYEANMKNVYPDMETLSNFIVGTLTTTPGTVKHPLT